MMTSEIKEAKIVNELLDETNYEDWKSCLETYLRREDLWDNVIIGQPWPQQHESGSTDGMTWEMKNKKALEAIQISCGETALEKIAYFGSARTAWEFLASKYRPRERVIPSGENEGCTQFIDKIKRFYPEIEYPTACEDDAANQRALEMILEFCSGRGAETLPYIEGLKSAKAAWDQLVTMHENPKGMEMTSHTWCLSFYKALLQEDLEKVNKFLDGRSDAMGARITESWDTPLHIAAQLGHEKLVQELISRMQNEPGKTEIVTRTDKDGNTAFSIAVAGGRIKMASSILNISEDVLWMRNGNNQIPIVEAAIRGKKEMVHYLYPMFKNGYRTNKLLINERDGATLLTALISIDIFDLALDLLALDQVLGVTLDQTGETALNALAKRPTAFPSGLNLGTLDSFISRYFVRDREINQESRTSPDDCCQIRLPLGTCCKYEAKCTGLQRLMIQVGNALKLFSLQRHYTEICKVKLMNKEARKLLSNIIEIISNSIMPTKLDEALRKAVVQASQCGTVEVIDEIKKFCPHLIVGTYDDQRRSIFHVAIVYRQEKVFNLIHEMGPLKEQLVGLVDGNKNSMLHLAAMLAPDKQLEKVPTAALQVQYELRWLKEMETIVEPKWKTAHNKDGQSPSVIFGLTHKNLIQEGRIWMNGMAKSSMIMATLIATVMFAAAFTIPGGNNNNTGTPILLPDNAFIVFVMSDATSLSSSIASVLMFLGILTSRYAVDDFLEVLQRKLILGLGFLFIAVLSMMVAFCATIYMILEHRSVQIYIPIIISLACCPIILSVILQLSHCNALIHYTYFPKIFRKPKIHYFH